MASIEKRVNGDGSATYRVKVRIKGSPALTATFDKEKDAKRWGAQIEADIRSGKFLERVESRKHLLREAIDRYTASVLSTRKKTTQTTYRSKLSFWRERLGGLSLDQVTPARVAELRDELLQTRTNDTVTTYLQMLHHVFEIASSEWGWTEVNPVSKVRRPKADPGRVRFLSADERERLLEACKQSKANDLYPVVVLLLCTGMRSQSECLALTWERVDLANGRILLDVTKNGSRRSVPLVDPARSILREWGAVRRLDDPRVFPAATPHAERDMSHAWAKALERAGIEDFHLHDLRHSCASWLAQSGASLLEIAEILGHKTLAMVKRYAHLTEGTTRESLERMSRKFM